MSRKKKHPEHENLERWLVSYADFITLLFATFTALYALSMSDQAKLKDVAEAIREGFSEQSIMSGIKSILQGKSPPTANPDPLSSKRGEGAGLLGKYQSLTYSPGEVEKVKDTLQDLKKDIAAINNEIKNANTGGPGVGAGVGGVRGIELAVQERGIRVSFDSSLFFQPGTAILKSESQEALGKVAVSLKKLASTNIIHVEGHTDDQPVFSALYPSNWELSTARSSTVVRYLIQKQGFDAVRMAAVGYGDSRPIASNRTAEGRSRNRRIDIIIYGKLVGRQVDPRAQFQQEQVLIKSQSPNPGSQIIKSLEEDGGLSKAPIPSIKSSSLEAKPMTAIKVVPDDIGKVSPILSVKKSSSGVAKKPASSDVKTPR